MIKYNCHTHSNFCDGNDTIEDMIKAAIKCDMKAIGISSHGPLPFETEWNMKKEKFEEYLKIVKELKEKYKKDIDVLIGLELDYLPKYGLDYVNNTLLDKLDYYIGSVHYLGEFKNGYKWCVDETVEVIQRGIKENFGGNVQKALERYYSNIADLAARYEPPVIGHLDLIKKNNKNNCIFNENESWYKKIVEDCLETIRKTNCIIEINTGGRARGYTEDFYPSEWILQMIKEKQIPITINSDAHFIAGINYEFNEVYELIKRLGFKNYAFLTSEGWKAKEVI